MKWNFRVTPFAGVWIEMISEVTNGQIFGVTPFAGVWIEMNNPINGLEVPNGHSLRGSVD